MGSFELIYCLVEKLIKTNVSLQIYDNFLTEIVTDHANEKFKEAQFKLMCLTETVYDTLSNETNETEFNNKFTFSVN